MFEILIPVWVLPALALVPTAFAWRLDLLARRRARIGLCQNCQYDRTGLTANANCPECDAAASRHA